MEAINQSEALLINQSSGIPQKFQKGMLAKEGFSKWS